MPPPANHTSAARSPRRAQTHQGAVPPRPVRGRLPTSKVGWDRKVRFIMIASFALVGYIGLKAGLALMQARAQASSESTLLSTLEAQHRQLLSSERALYQPATIERDARALGMVRAGERPYVVVASGHH